MRIAIDIFIFCLLVYVIIDAIREYHDAVGSVWQRLLGVGKSTATILWARIIYMAAGFLDALEYGADFVGAPGVSDSLKTYLSPTTVAALMIGIAFISELARRRRGSTQSITSVG